MTFITVLHAGNIPVSFRLYGPPYLVLLVEKKEKHSKKGEKL